MKLVLFKMFRVIIVIFKLNWSRMVPSHVIWLLSKVAVAAAAGKWSQSWSNLGHQTAATRSSSPDLKRILGWMPFSNEMVRKCSLMNMSWLWRTLWTVVTVFSGLVIYQRVLEAYWYANIIMNISEHWWHHIKFFTMFLWYYPYLFYFLSIEFVRKNTILTFILNCVRSL